MKIFVNVITTLRFLYTIILPFLQVKISNLAFIVNLIVLFLTDTIDGFLARKFKVQSMFGSIMDTVADKMLSVVLLFILVKEYNILAIILMCEVMIGFLNVIGMAFNKKTKSSKIGKLKMWLLAISIVLSYMSYFNIVEYNVVYIFSIITIILQTITFACYVQYLNDPKNSITEKHKVHNLKDLLYVLFDTEYYLSVV